ncbi:MAG: hydantoinase/carbamoylase family amidase [Gammaproteobacteria bacterium]|nr:hydantoinase/carbamoylase family amidase [Gammaproteobacteria bacterium]
MDMIEADRLLANLHALREFGRRGNGVVRRCLDDADMAARYWLVERMQDAGLDAGIDGIANVLGLSPNPGPALLLGSHSDTQPAGGWLDGALGVIYGIEVAQALHDNPTTRGLAIDVASWADEESHYLGLMGSRSFCGQLDEAEIDGARNDDGHPLRSALAAQGLQGRPRFSLDTSRYRGYLEAHIEQGPWLERESKRIGVVTSIVGMRDLTIRVRGQQNHAGTTPMHLRHDAAQALFEFNHRVNQAFARIGGDHSVWTLGQVRIEPFARSIVPGLAEANLQFRAPEQARVEALQDCVLELAADFNRGAAAQLQVSVFDDTARAVAMDDNLQRALADAAAARIPGGWQYMPSGAAHDAQVLATRMPAGMLFIPSIGGISHDFTEDSHEEDIVLGCEVLADAVVDLLTRSSETA